MEQNKISENNYYQMRQKFYHKFKENILPKLKKYEIKRKQWSKIVNILIIAKYSLFLAAFILFYAFFLAVVEENPLKAAIASFAIIIMGCLKLSELIKIPLKTSIANKFKNETKTHIMPLLCKIYSGLILKYYPKTFKTENYTSILADCCILPSNPRIIHDDRFMGKYKDISFEILESRSKKYSETEFVFDGVIIKFDMNKNFNSHTVIWDKALCMSISNELPRLQMKNLNRIKLEDVKFNDKYYAFSNDEIEARYLLTPSFIERILNIKNVFSSDKINCSFYKGFLLVSIYTKKDLFEICSLDRPVDDFGQYEVFYNEIISIYKLIDHFKLNENTGL